MKMKKRILIVLAGVMVLGMFGTQGVPMMASETGDPEFTISIPAELTIQKSGLNEVGEIIMRNESSSKYIMINSDKTGGYGDLVNKNDTTKIIHYKLCYQEYPTSTIQPFGDKGVSFHFSREKRLSIHVDVDEYSDMPPGVYEDTVTITASLLDE